MGVMGIAIHAHIGTGVVNRAYLWSLFCFAARFVWKPRVEPALVVWVPVACCCGVLKTDGVMLTGGEKVRLVCTAFKQLVYRSEDVVRADRKRR